MNTRMQEDVFDLVLKYALLDCSNDEISALKQEPKTDHTEMFSKNVDKLVSKRKRTLALMEVPRWTRRVAACLIMVFAVFSGILLTAPPVQAAVQDVIVEWTDRYTNFSFSKPLSDVSVKEIQLNYLPNGFLLQHSSIKEHGISRLIYENKEKEEIELFCSSADQGYNTDVDNEHAKKTAINVKKENLLYLESFVSGYPSYLTWTDKGLFLTLIVPGEMKSSEIKEIAENIAIKVK